MNEVYSHKGFWLTTIFLTGFLLYLLGPILTPFLMAAILGYLGDPLADKLETWNLSRTLAVTVVFLIATIILLVVLLILFPLIESQLVKLITVLPTYIDYIQRSLLPAVSNLTGIDSKADLEIIKQQLGQNWFSITGFAASILASLSESGLFLIAFLSNLVLIPVIAFYFMRDWDVMVARINIILPRRIEPLVSRLAKESDEVLASFLRGQLSVMISLGIIYSLGLWLAGLDFALLVGMLAGLVSFVPYLGFIVGIAAAIIASIMQYQDFAHLIPIFLVFGFGQLVESFLLTPLLVGDRIGLHPVAVIFALMAGGQLFGFTGILLALPVSAVIMVLLRYVYSSYLGSHAYAYEVAAVVAATVAEQKQEKKAGEEAEDKSPSD